MNIITAETTKEELHKEYKTYPDSAPQGFKEFHSSRTDPIYWEIPDNCAVLDVGANSGEFLKRLVSNRKNIKAKGIDLSEVAVKAAQEKGLDVVIGDGEHLPYEDKSFDYVLLMEVLSHTFDPKKMLSEIRRVLKDDGVLLGSCPHKNLEMNIWDDQRMHRAYYTSEDVYGLLRDHFDKVYLKVLRGGQFSIGMAATTMGDKDAEILFKSGKEDLKPWDWQLLEKDTLRVWFGPTQYPGDVYYRMTGYADKMNKMDRVDSLYSGFDFNINGGPGEWQHAFKRMDGNIPANSVVVNQLDNMLKIADLSVWQITYSYHVLAFFMAYKDLRKKPFITEIDDWLFDIPSYNPASNPYRPNSEMERIAWQQIQLSDALIVSTQFIKDSLKDLFPNKRIFVVPNSIDFSIYDNLKFPEKDGKIRIGYTGCLNHNGDMEIIKEPLMALINEFPNLELVISCKFDSWKDVTHERVLYPNTMVNIHQYPQFIANWNMDIGIAPLRDSNFNRAKSNLRWLEYSGIKVPTVASKIYPFANSINDSKDGFVCNSKQAWYDTLKMLIVDEKKRKEVGLKSYERVKKDFNMDKIALMYKSILQTIKDEVKS